MEQPKKDYRETIHTTILIVATLLCIFLGFVPSPLILFPLMILVWAGIVNVIMPTSVRQLMLATAAIAIGLSIFMNYWPMKVAFWLHRSAFDSCVARIQAGEQPATPFWIGIYHVDKIKQNENGVVCFWLNERYGGNDGFVFTNGSESLGVNIGFDSKIDDDWVYVSED